MVWLACLRRKCDMSDNVVNVDASDDEEKEHDGCNVLLSSI